MMTYLFLDKIKDQYKPGKAFAAVKNDKVVGIRYIDDFRFDISVAPKWVQAVKKLMDDMSLPTRWEQALQIKTTENVRDFEVFSENDLTKIKDTAIAFGHPSFNITGDEFSALDIVQNAKNILEKLNQDSLADYKRAMIQELSTIDNTAIFSGNCSDGQFFYEKSDYITIKPTC